MSLSFRFFVFGIIWTSTIQLFLIPCDGHGMKYSTRSRNMYVDRSSAKWSDVIRRLFKREAFRSSQETKPVSKFTLPKCPIQGNKSLDYDYCYCQLRYPPPKSQLTGEPFLKGYYKQCLNPNEPKLPNFNSLPLLEKYLVAFSSPFWDCKEGQFLPNQVHLFYPYLCVRNKMIPLTGTFYEIPQPLTRRATKYETRKYFANLKPRMYTWPLPGINHHRLYKGSLTRTSGEKKANFLQDSTRVQNWNWEGHQYKVSGGPGCFAALGVYRRGVSSSYDCDIHIDPSTPPSLLDCDLIDSIVQDARSKILNVQLKTLFEFGPNGTITHNPNSTGKDHFKPKVTQYIIPASSNAAFEDAGSRIPFCPNQLVGLHITFVHHGLQFVAAKFGERTGKRNRLSFIVPIEMSFQSMDADSKYFSKLSRFWYEFYHGDCIDQFCWRDLVRFPIEDENFLGNLDGVIVLIVIPLAGLVMAFLLFQGDLSY